MNKARLRAVPEDMSINSKHETNECGYLEVTGYAGSRNVSIRFLDTGSERVVTAQNIRKGKVKDMYMPSLYGVGFLGEGKYSAKRGDSAYAKWVSVMARCNNPNKYPAYIGCSVAVEWHNFQNFAEWYYENKIEGFDLDKDIKIDGNKVYGPDTCLFVSRQDNIEKAHAGHFSALSPSGDVVNFYNMRRFCRENGLDNSGLSAVLLKKKGCDSIKGWRALP